MSMDRDHFETIKERVKRRKEERDRQRRKSLLKDRLEFEFGPPRFKDRCVAWFFGWLLVKVLNRLLSKRVIMVKGDRVLDVLEEAIARVRKGLGIPNGDEG